MEGVLVSFLIFSVTGWVIELLYRSLILGKVTNPGFLKGPYLPIYGFGGMFGLFVFSYLEKFTLIGAFAAFVLIIAFLEYFTGFFFFHIFKIRLWDYSNRKFNLHGFICLRFLFYWLILIVFFRYFLFDYFIDLTENFSFPGKSLFLLGLVYGFFIIDIIQSLGLAYRIRKTINRLGKTYLSPKVLTFRMLYREVAGELSERIDHQDLSYFESFYLRVTIFFRLARGAGEEVGKVLRKRIKTN